MRSNARAGGRQVAAILAAITTVVLAVAYMTVYRGASAPPSLQSLEKARERSETQAQSRQMLEKAERQERQRQVEGIERRLDEAEKRR